MVWLALAENSTGVGRRIAAAGNSNQNAGRGRGARPFTLELNCLDSDERSPCAPPFAVDGRRPRVSRTVVTAAVEGATCLMQISPVYFLLPTVCSFPAVQSGAAGSQTPGRPNVGLTASVPKVCTHPMSRGCRGSEQRSLRTRLQNESQVDRYAAFLRLASSRESTNATIPSMTV
jgi:hypothetical protein